jgi:tetratricopeptide (TPR) repeat protein
MKDRQEEYKSLLQVQDIRDITTKEALEISGRLIDLSLDLHQLSGITKALQFLAEIGTRELSAIERTQLHYFRANAIANQSCIAGELQTQTWAWERTDLEEQILHLRLALRASLDTGIPSELLCAVRTNLGNVLSHVGRFVEAIEHWNKALAGLPNFGMAQANRGVALCHYAEAVHHPHDALPLLRRAVADLEVGIRSGNLLAQSSGYFRQYYSWAAENVALLESHVLSSHSSYGTSDREVEYRKWCAENRLCLNFLNDIASDPTSARDGLLLPPIVLPIGTGPRYHGLFNQLKQEFVAARFFLSIPSPITGFENPQLADE